VLNDTVHRFNQPARLQQAWHVQRQRAAPGHQGEVLHRFGNRCEILLPDRIGHHVRHTLRGQFVQPGAHAGGTLRYRLPRHMAHLARHLWCQQAHQV
jgi:hypothetical protein